MFKTWSWVYKLLLFISLVSDPKFPRPAGLWSPWWQGPSYCGEGAWGDRWEVDGGEPKKWIWEAVNHYLPRNGAYRHTHSACSARAIQLQNCYVRHLTCGSRYYNSVHFSESNSCYFLNRSSTSLPTCEPHTSLGLPMATSFDMQIPVARLRNAPRKFKRLQNALKLKQERILQLIICEHKDMQPLNTF